MECCVCPMWAHVMLSGLNLWCSISCLELPDFVPNEYFWKTHLKEGEQKWQCYARCVKEIMAKEGGMGQSNATIEDKWHYKSLVFPKPKKGKHSD